MNHSCIKVIGPRHHTMYSSKIDRSNILPFGQRPKVIITSASDCPRTYKKALISADKALWEVAIKKELQAMNDLRLDFNKTYSPTGRLNSLQTLIAFAASRNLEFHQADVKSALQNAPLTETVFLSIPQGLNLDQRKCFLKLNKEIYVLKQVPLARYERLRKWLLKSRFSS
ncbi:hypothetical protein O181_023705 [Austropuccinia psidii MF-1]|uniref:Reverse transcriptase Ty1/copia-type domain-containing protein n=1 Tax=Austropuccinia psidii MF-1 TaxID=1389203 RepID=A0A9Q3CJL2_9BASI|nr:hypothetical protein [Austropuccinia psidii MF-1]